MEADEPESFLMVIKETKRKIHMPAKTIPIPEGYHSVTPYLIIKDATKAIEFYKRAFGAKEIGRISMPDGKVGHAELQIGSSRIMLADEFPEWGHKSPITLGGSPIGLGLYVENVDDVFKKAISEGATTDKNMEVKDQFYGDRSGTVIDPFGHKWTISTHIEDVSFKEMQKRSDEMFIQHRS
jgi:PhnB protein